MGMTRIVLSEVLSERQQQKHCHHTYKPEAAAGCETMIYLHACNDAAAADGLPACTAYAVPMLQTMPRHQLHQPEGTQEWQSFNTAMNQSGSAQQQQPS
jgi:hypothetical protein